MTPLPPEFPLSRRELAEVLDDVADALGLGADQVGLRLVGDAEMAALNRRHAGLPGPTNVLSFEAAEDGEGLGELVLSVDTLQRETFLYGQEPREHLVRLLAHGLLHLAGLDHGPEMEAMTEATVNAAGFPSAS
ncbi:rRNA maturation RNase YbeY [Desulfohalovibrio reitneri]|uniref:rRNA maturation RNase YbeY n=1 Tax=Desulfohalovibrio reitneri TaxID=1307759 RepID=UPI0004A6BD88|nr:rRNA maturation RNase YbeY [Desulfohalovibrio reitneri]